MAPPLRITVIEDISNVLKANEALVSSTTATTSAISGDYAAMSANVAKNIERSVASQKAMIAANQAQMKSMSGDALLAMQVRTEAMQNKLNRQLGITPVAMGKVSAAEKTAERDLGKLTRGALAGSGVFSKLGRSLAFASTGFIAVAGGATALHLTITAAEDLAAAQRRVNQQLQSGGKSWAQYGGQITATVDKLRGVAGFTDTDLLQSFSVLVRATNNVGSALKTMGVAADTARALNKPLAATSVALGKALAGNTAALKRMGVTLPAGVKGLQAINYVAQKFAGQAEAGTTASERFSAQIQHTAAVIGTALLPTFDRIVTELGNWFQKMNDSGRIAHDAASAFNFLGHIFHALENALHAVDKVTGSLGNTIRLLVTIWGSFKIVAAIAAVEQLAGAWTNVAAQATIAAEAEGRALGGGIGGGAGRGAGPAPGGGAGFLPFALVGAGGAVAGRARSKVAERVGQYTGDAAAETEKSAGTWEKIGGDLGRFGRASLSVGRLIEGAALFFGGSPDQVGRQEIRKINGLRYRVWIGSDGAIISSQGPIGIKENLPFLQAVRTAPRTGTIVPGALQAPGFQLPGPRQVPMPFSSTQGPPTTFRSAILQWASFQERISDQLAAAQASLTASTQDDVAAAKKALQHIKGAISRGHLSGARLVQAYEAEAAALGIISSAEDEAAAKRQAQWQHARDRAQKALENMIDPIKLEVALSQAQATGGDITSILKSIRASARKALASGKLSLKQQKEAWDEIASVNDQLKQQTQQVQFQFPPKLELALARDQALGRDTTKDLLRMKRAILKFIRTHRKNIAAVTDAYNQLASINSQLGQGMDDVRAALGLFKQANLKRAKDMFGLTAKQIAALSQLGPKGYMPGHGVGAAGYAINPDTGRPIMIHHTIKLDGKTVATSTTKHQQRARRRSPRQHRGPNAGAAAA